ncbi:AAA family ATPase [Dyella flagellata]|uniref:Chromosome segregation protein SMC n=1 Tax=Dyella flagellata TaxID=1867833 RepID=A0ABQ5X6J8_9GAMM|nr:AAA family ATPase [Dyella flagellata]GLQ87250.1 chromosome segregation protein SMC [Dyella flagellata]
MTHLYLTGIELSDFRSFGSLQIDLAPEPGVLIVHGSNGLGKSSLFDALEWALTGNIDHFSSVDGYAKFGNYLCRWGSRSDPTTAALAFSDGNRIARQLDGQKARESTLNGVPDIAEYLRLPDWQAPISSLSRYLLLTHFLGQSSLSRLTHRDPGERLAILKEVSQSAKLQKFGLALHGEGKTLPARAFKLRIEQLGDEVDVLSDALDQEERLWSGSQASGALDDGDAAKLTSEIANALNVLWRKLISTRSPFVWDKLPDPGNIQSAIDQGAELARKRELAILEARRLLALRDRHYKALTETSGASEAAERDLIVAVGAMEAAKQELTRRQNALSATAEPLAVARSMHASVVALREAAITCEAARNEREKAESDLAKARASLVEAEQLVQRNERRTQIEARLREEVANLERRLGLSSTRIERVRTWLDYEGQIDQVDAELHDLKARHPDIDNQIGFASSNLSAARLIETGANEALRTVERSVSALSNAVSTVATHLSHNAQDCPVCATHFASPADLSERAGAAAKRLAPLVLAQQEALSDAQLLVATATTNLEQLRGIAERLRSLFAKRNSDRDGNDRLLTGLGLAADVSRSSVESWLAELVKDEVRLEKSRRRRARWLGRFTANGRAISRASEAARRRDTASLLEATTMRRLDDCKVAEQVAGERIATLAVQLYSGRAPSREQIEEAVVVSATALAAAQKAYDDAATTVSEQDLRLAPLREAEANLRARIAQAVVDQESNRIALTDISGKWRDAGWVDEDFDETKIEAAASNLNQARESLAEADALLKRLRDGREAWNRQIAHRAAINRVRGLTDLAPNSTREQVRVAAMKKLEMAKRDALATTQSKEIASKASILIADAVNKFNAAYLDPLQLLANRINQAILCDPRIGIGLTLQKRGIKQSASVTGEMPKNLNSVDPMLVHSEGQMAALAVSMLCAASLTYPWSRWRALILDDPLQHNDAIHAAAFADFIGNLVRAKSYQVLLSTHDLGQAEFLQRKFCARNIPCAVLNLLGRGNNGVDWAFRPSSEGAFKTAALN